MFFLSPLALLGLAAVLVPPLLHLFQRRRPPVVEFPAVRYLRQTERDAERQVRLQHLLLMLLRVAAVVLLVLAAARPVVPGGGAGLHEPTALVLVVDNSLSSGAVAGGARVADALAARARETLRAAQAGDAVWLIEADGVARRGAPAELLERAARLSPSPRRLDLTAAVLLGGRLIAGSGYARGEVHLLSDLQRSALDVDRGPSPVDRSVTDTVRGARSTIRDLQVLVYHPAGAPPANRAIVAAEPQPPVWVGGVGAVAVTVGGAPSGAAPAAAQLVMEGRSGGRALAPAGGQAVLAAPRTEPGWRSGLVSLEPDELRADDAYAVAVRVLPPPRVRVASGEDAGAFLGEALRVLADNGQLVLAEPADVTLGVISGGASVVWPPADAARLGALNRGLAAAGVPWRYGAAVLRDDSLLAPGVPELARSRALRRNALEPAGDTAGSVVLATAGGGAWLVRHGRVVLLGSRLGAEATTLPLSSNFVPFVAALAGRLARGEAGVITVLSGAAVSLAASVTGLATPDSMLLVRGGTVIEAPTATGVYAQLAGRDTVGMLVVVPDARESDLTRSDADDLRAALPGARITVTDDPSVYAAERFRGAGRSELTGWLLAAGLLVLVVESLVASGFRPARVAAAHGDTVPRSTV